MIINQKRKIKLNGKYYNINVTTYKNKRICLEFINKEEKHELTINLEDVYIDNGRVFLNPIVKKNGLLKELKKKRIIKDICGSINYNYIDIPIAVLNMGILRKFDNYGVNKYLQRINGLEDYYE